MCIDIQSVIYLFTSILLKKNHDIYLKLHQALNIVIVTLLNLPCNLVLLNVILVNVRKIMLE